MTQALRMIKRPTRPEAARAPFSRPFSNHPTCGQRKYIRFQNQRWFVSFISFFGSKPFTPRKQRVTKSCKTVQAPFRYVPRVPSNGTTVSFHHSPLAHVLASPCCQVVVQA